MPTGYTAELMNKGMDFKSFVFRCARAFGALIMMRDDPMDAPIPEKIEPSDYHVKALAETKQKYKRLKTMTNDEKIAFGVTEKEKEIKVCREYLTKAMAENDRLTKMALQIKAWKPPTSDHEGLKKFMIDQIGISMNDLSWSRKRLEKVEEEPPVAYYAAAVSNAEQGINYHNKENLDEIKRAADRTEWVQQLRASL